MIDDHSFISPIFLTLLEYFHNTRIIPQFHLHRSSLIHPSSSASVFFLYENAIEWCIVNITYSKSFSFDWFTMNAYEAPFIDSNYLHASLAIDTSYISKKYKNFCVKNVSVKINYYLYISHATKSPNFFHKFVPHNYSNEAYLKLLLHYCIGNERIGCSTHKPDQWDGRSSEGKTRKRQRIVRGWDSLQNSIVTRRGISIRCRLFRRPLGRREKAEKSIPRSWRDRHRRSVAIVRARRYAA